MTTKVRGRIADFTWHTLECYVETGGSNPASGCLPSCRAARHNKDVEWVEVPWNEVEKALRRVK